jgi:hypothetical protein
VHAFAVLLRCRNPADGAPSDPAAFRHVGPWSGAAAPTEERGWFGSVFTSATRSGRQEHACGVSSVCTRTLLLGISGVLAIDLASLIYVCELR